MKLFPFASLSAFALALCAAASAFADAPKPVEPENGAEIDVTPPVVRLYKNPEQRNWDLDYRPGSLKEKNEQDCSQPAPVVFKWEPATAPGAVSTLQISTSPDFPDYDLIEVDAGAETTAKATNFDVGTKYYWRVKAQAKKADDAFAVCYSDTREFTTANVLPRWYDLPDLSNVRDAGGWLAANGTKRMKKGLVFRGGEFDQHSGLTEESKKYVLDTMGIKVDLDLRGPSEWKNVEGYYSPLGKTVDWQNFRIGGYDGIFNEANEKLFRDMFHMLSKRESYPIYIHCLAGADRTGTTLAALKSVLGCSDLDISTDYELTSFSKFGERRIGGGAWQNMLKKLDEYGEKDDPISIKFTNWLKKAGVTDEELQSIRDILLEDLN